MRAPNITDDDAKARAAMRGVRITAAYINGARNLLAKRETAVPPAPTDAPATEPAVDAEALIKQVVGKLQAQGNAEAERLRDAMRKAMAMLASASGDA